MAIPQLNRRKFLYTSALTLGGASALGADGFVESNYPRVVRLEISLKRLPQIFDGFTIAQLSDFHYDDHFSVIPIRKAVEIVNELRPDVIALTGDFVTAPVLDRPGPLRRAGTTAAPCAEILSHLQSPLGKFAVLGNHDGEVGAAQVAGVLRDHQITVLGNKSVPLERGSARLWLAGVDDALRGWPDLSAAISKIPTNDAILLLAHEPDFADDASLSPIDLQLSGHSHGGQIWIPGIGAPWLPPMAREYPRGLYRVGDLILYTNIGIGTIHAPIRINCPPEVTLITLRARDR